MFFCIGLFFCVQACILNQYRPVLSEEKTFGELERRYFRDALRSIKATKDDLRFKRDYVEDDYRFSAAAELLNNPLLCPEFAESVQKTFMPERSISDIVESMADASDADIDTSEAAEEIKENYLPDLNKPMPVSPELERSLKSFLLKCLLIDDKVKTAFSEILSEEMEILLIERFAENGVMPDEEETAEAKESYAGDISYLNSLGITNAEIRAASEKREEMDDETWVKANILGPYDRMDRNLLFTAGVEYFEAVEELKTDILELREKSGSGETRRTGRVSAGVSSVAAQKDTRYFPEKRTEILTPLGKIIIGSWDNDEYEDIEHFLIIDPDGKDVYRNSGGGAAGYMGRRLSTVIDLAGDDRYMSFENGVQGAGIFGIGAVFDLSGNDIYEGKSLSQGAGYFGIGVLSDEQGDDVYRADKTVQGAGAFGAGLLCDSSGKDVYYARLYAQGFGYTGGIGALHDETGDDLYYAGGLYHDYGRLPEDYLSLSQGFAIGIRPYASGGIGMLIDDEGNDFYNGDVYAQGTSYWYSVGILIDSQGNDTYNARHYAQGSGIHLSTGILIEKGGHDKYACKGCTQGFAHDYAVGWLLDKWGHDYYTCDGGGQGTAVNNSVAVFIDSAGNDGYFSKKADAQGSAQKSSREYGSIAVFIDLAGKDAYTAGGQEGMWRTRPYYAAGVDVEANLNQYESNGN